MSSSEFVPPLYKKFGKDVNDLLNQKFSYDRLFRVRTTTNNGIEVTTSGTLNDTGYDFSGVLKAKYTNKCFGNAHVQCASNGSTEAQVEAKKLADGVVVRAKATVNPSAKVDVEYRKEFVSATLSDDVSKKAYVVGATGVIGFDGVAVGGEVQYDMKSSQFKDFGAGMEYTQKDFTATVKTKKKVASLDASWVHTVNPDLKLGGLSTYNFFTRKWGVGAVASYSVDRDCNVKVKACDKGVIAAVIEQRLSNPSLTLRFTAEANAAKKATGIEKFGVTALVGEGFSARD